MNLETKTEAYVGPDRTVTACWTENDAPKSCKTIAMPKMVGQVSSVLVTSPVEGSRVTWYAFSSRHSSLCSLKSDASAVYCVRLSHQAIVPSNVKLLLSKSAAEKHVLATISKIEGSDASARAKIRAAFAPARGVTPGIVQPTLVLVDEAAAEPAAVAGLLMKAVSGAETLVQSRGAAVVVVVVVVILEVATIVEDKFRLATT